MSETPAETAARFKAKNDEYARIARTGRWPIFDCADCRHRSSQVPVCCKRDWHHVGDCCTHCGNDERSL